MNIENIKEIIFCNKNGKVAAIAKSYANEFTEISVKEAIKLASEVEYRILKSKEEIEQLHKEIENRSNKKTHSVGYVAATLATAGALIMGSTSCALTRDTSNVNETGATEVTTQANYAEESDTQTVDEASTETEASQEAPVEEDFNSLLQASKSNTQRRTIQMMSDYINYFNGDFANHYAETVQVRDSEGNLTGEVIEVKPALLWDYEVPALTIAYNDYSTRELQEIFNGTQLDANTLDANYKNGTLQLFGAYVISDRAHPVNLSALIESPEGKAFVQKYEDLFYSIKEAKTEEEQIEAVNAFYRELFKDFPIDDYTREVGISHSDSRNLILDQQYKLAITPIAAAVETMYQNLAIDHTLSDKAIAYFNNLGYCPLAYSSFQKAERATESNTYNEDYADYEVLSRLLINLLRAKGYYVIGDENRDLSQLRIFQANVNGHFEVIDGQWVYVGGSAILSTTVETYQEIVDQWSTSSTRTWTETSTTRTSNRDEAVALAGEREVREAERKVDEQIEQENERAREEAERRADQEQARQQEQENQHAQQVRDEVAQDAEDMQQRIDNANDTINNGGTVNENDFGDHDVDFDDAHSDEHGNLDNSVENITTDGTGAVDASDPLPDPNETGRAFDERHKSNAPQGQDDDDQEAFAYDYEEEVVTTQPEQEVETAVEETYSSEQEVVEPVDTSEYVDTTPSYEDYGQTPTADYDNVDYSSSDDEAVYYSYEDIDYEEEYTTTTTSDEELVDAYVESLSAEEQTTSSTKTI